VSKLTGEQFILGVHTSPKLLLKSVQLQKFIEEAEWAWWVMQTFKMVTGVVDSTLGAVAPRVTAAHGPLIAVWSQRL